ncbi:hypothetical protein EOM09_02230 [bacterium]|nr:hypothetical protein [bacterium]
MKKVLILLVLVALSSSLFAGVKDLSYNEKSGIVTYKYVTDVKLVNRTYNQDKILRVKALNGLAESLKELFKIEAQSVDFSMVEYIFDLDTNQVEVAVSLESFYVLNQHKIP